MKRQLERHLARAFWMAAALAMAVGCASKPKAATSVITSENGSVLYGTFVQQGTAQLDPETPITRVITAGNDVYVYTQDNHVYGLTPGLEIRFLQQIGGQIDNLGKVVQVGEELIFPTAKGLTMLDKNGTLLRTLAIEHPLTSDLHVDPRGLLLAGTASPTGGRVSIIDPRRTINPTIQDTLIGNVQSAPVSLQGIVFAATEKGEVFAIAAENKAVWPLEGMGFDTGRAIEANLVVDDFALYVASSDGTLYALDRGNGRIKWRYMAETALGATPVVTADTVYQVVPEKGLVAINKADGKLYREPTWTAADVTKIVATDDRYVYALRGKGELVALGVKDGAVKFSASGHFDHVAAGADGTIFAATKNGALVSLKRGPYAGEVAAGN